MNDFIEIIEYFCYLFKIQDKGKDGKPSLLPYTPKASRALKFLTLIQLFEITVPNSLYYHKIVKGEDV